MYMKKANQRLKTQKDFRWETNYCDKEIKSCRMIIKDLKQKIRNWAIESKDYSKESTNLKKRTMIWTRKLKNNISRFNNTNNDLRIEADIEMMLNNIYFINNRKYVSDRCTCNIICIVLNTFDFVNVVMNRWNDWLRRTQHLMSSIHHHCNHHLCVDVLENQTFIFYFEIKWQ